MRTWFLTSTTYGTWLPGDERGFVSNTPNANGDWVRQNVWNSPCAADDAARKRLALSAMKGKPVSFHDKQATEVAAQFQETTQVRGWKPHVLAVMATHFHILLSADEAVAPADLLRDLKSYASRRLNRQWTRPASGTWWTESGSRRPVNDEDYFINAVRYTARQPLKLAFWIDPALEHLLINPSERGASAP